MKNKNQGITLIALIITVILLLILAGVAISSLTGKDGMLEKISAAKEISEQAHIKEEIGLRIQEFYIEKAQEGKLAEANLQNLSTYLSNKLDNVVIKEVTNEKLVIEYKGYELQTNNQNNVELVGKVGLRIEYGFDNQGYSKDSAVMTFNISTPSGVTVTSITPLTEGTQVVEANSKFKFTANGIYEFKVVMSNNTEKIVKVSVDKIDTEAPNADIKLIESYNFINGTIKAKVTLTDDNSGVSLQNSKWIINTSNAALGADASKYTGGTFTAETQEISSARLTTTGNYYFHVLVTDNAGNAKEYISDVATIKQGYAISTPQDFQNIKNNLTASYYVVNDIDMKDFNFTMIGGTFQGILDGQGYKISNLSYSRTTNDNYTAIFYRTKKCTIKNIIFENISITGLAQCVAAVTGFEDGSSTFKKIGVTGTIKGMRQIGTIIGGTTSPATVIEDCYGRTTLIGENGDYSASWSYIGGIVGNWNSECTITNCYWSGTIGEKNVTLLGVGTIFPNKDSGNTATSWSSMPTATGCFYNKTLFTLKVPAAVSVSGTALTTEQFKDASNFTEKGWDFENTWEIGTSGYPELKFEKK